MPFFMLPTLAISSKNNRVASLTKSIAMSKGAARLSSFRSRRDYQDPVRIGIHWLFLQVHAVVKDLLESSSAKVCMSPSVANFDAA
jgi:hypothetical protein